MKVLFVNHRQQHCGVYQFGKRVFDLIQPSTVVKHFYVEVESEREFRESVTAYSPDILLYNWYPVTMPWLSEHWVSSNAQFKHYFLFHDGFVRQNYDLYLFSGAEGKDLTLPKEKTRILPRPLFKYTGSYPVNDEITIGSFGFGGWQKGFTTLVEMVNKQFDKAIINIQMPFAYFGDRKGVETRKIADACRNLNTNPNITLNISHSFLSNNDTLTFLAGNDINVFLYRSSNQGLSSVLDYALSVKRPIALTNDSMFKHIYMPQMDVEKHTLMEIKESGTAHLNELYKGWNPEGFHKEMEKIYASQ